MALKGREERIQGMNGRMMHLNLELRGKSLWKNVVGKKDEIAREIYRNI